MKKYLLSIAFIIGVTSFSFAQKAVDYTVDNEFEIGGVTVSGNENTDGNAIISISGLTVGKTIKVPGSEVSKSIKALWRLRLFTDVRIEITKQIGNVVFLEIIVQELPKLSRFSFKGTKKSYEDDLNSSVDRYLLKGAIVTESIKSNAVNEINAFFIEKGYLDVQTEAIAIPDSLFKNSIRLVFNVDRGDRVKIQDIVFTGNKSVKDKKLRKQFENTTRKAKIFSSSKLIDNLYQDDKKTLVNYYNTLGFRDAQITSDSIYRLEDNGDLMVVVNIDEGQQYFFRNITWKGNSIYTNEGLSQVLAIDKGDIYNQALLEQRLQFSEDSRDVTSQYMDNGYLFFQVTPTELAIVDDSVDLEIRIFEGPQATIDRVSITGNDRTHEEVIRREIRTKPGQKFSRSDIIRSQREITNLGYFNPEALQINTPVDPQKGTVDIEYVVEEKPSDQLELSAGWGGLGRGVIGTLGVTFNNFSLRNIAKKETWSPLPQGDGQRLSLRGQTNGQFYQAYNFSFTEPWLGGKKPNAFTLAAYSTRFASTDVLIDGAFEPSNLTIAGGSVGIGTRLKWPDDFFVSNTSINYQNITVNNYPGFSLEDGTAVRKGSFNNLSLNQTFSRNSIDNPIFPRSGSRFTFSGQVSLPYSYFRGDDINYDALSTAEKFKWLEYHKWKINAEWYTPIIGKLTLKAAAKIGLLGSWNDAIGTIPFERFLLGGDGISNFAGIQGKDIISLRGYETSDLAINVATNEAGASAYNKFTLELRYPISLNPMSTIYVLGFFEGGNAYTLDQYDPFDLKRSAGLGLRVFLPMFGTLGFDYGIGFDKDLPTGSGLTEYGNFNIILGFEPE
jgi:outer membrane protein insertion porin family